MIDYKRILSTGPNSYVVVAVSWDRVTINIREQFACKAKAEAFLASL